MIIAMIITSYYDHIISHLASSRIISHHHDHPWQVLQHQADSYPSDGSLRHAFNEDMQWETYKNQIGAVIAKQSSHRGNLAALPVFDSGMLGDYELKVRGH